LNQYNDLMKMPVQPKPCKTCPFEGEQPIGLSERRQTELYQNLVEGRNQLCHSVDNKKICRGGRNITLRVFCARGFIAEPTDEALADAYKQFEENNQ
jgi:hypothetical protein